jgi:hypothetical protein
MSRGGKRRYGPEDLLILTSLEVAQRLEHMYFGEDGFTPERAIDHIRWEAGVMGIEELHVHEIEGWWLIEGNDWFPMSDVHEVFNRLLQFREAGINAHRTEVFLTTFAQVVLTSLDGEVTVIKDDVEQATEATERFAEQSASSERVIVFLP